MSSLVLLRHGDTDWSEHGRVTGWVDIGLSDTGRQQARAGGRQLADAGAVADVVYTSQLRRARQTAALVVGQWHGPKPVIRADWRLNERYFGMLQGMDRDAAVLRFGNAQRQAWLRTFHAAPPTAVGAGVGHRCHASTVAHPVREAETLGQLAQRVWGCWQERIVGDLAAGLRVLVVAHLGSLRVLRQHLEGRPEDQIPRLLVAPGIPLGYEYSPGRPGCWRASSGSSVERDGTTG